MSKRYRTLEHVYAGEWAQVENLKRDGARVGVAPQPWTSAVEARDAHVDRWYAPDELEEAIAGWREAAGAAR